MFDVQLQNLDLLVYQCNFSICHLCLLQVHCSIIAVLNDATNTVLNHKSNMYLNVSYTALKIKFQSLLIVNKYNTIAFRFGFKILLACELPIIS